MSPKQVEKASVNVALTTIIIAVIAIGGFTYAAGQEVSFIVSRTSALECDLAEVKNKVEICESKGHETDLRLVEISTELKNIGALLVEIKERL